MLTQQETLRKLREIGYGRDFYVKFRKTNGDIREMHCMMDRPDEPPRQVKAVPVRDLDLGEWRSFRTDSVMEIY